MELRRKAKPGCGLSRCVDIEDGTFPLDCFGLEFVVWLWIEMVMTLCLSVADEKVLACS